MGVFHHASAVCQGVAGAAGALVPGLYLVAAGLKVLDHIVTTNAAADVRTIRTVYSLQAAHVHATAAVLALLLSTLIALSVASGMTLDVITTSHMTSFLFKLARAFAVVEQVAVYVRGAATTSNAVNFVCST